MKLTVLEEAMFNVLRDVVANAQPIPTPLGPPMTEHVDTYAPSIERARELLKTVEEHYR
jgi:hypothetical protein